MVRDYTRVRAGGQYPQHNVAVRLVEGLPHGFILGASFLRKHGSVMGLENGGTSKPAPESPWVLSMSRGGGVASEESIAVIWQAFVKKVVTRTAEETGVGAAMLDKVCAVKPLSEEEEELLEVGRPRATLNGGGASWGRMAARCNESYLCVRRRR